MLLPLLMLGVGVVAGPPLAIDLHVDASAACGGANGTAASPYCRVEDALAAAVDGDVIHIAAGTYVENLTVGRDVTLRSLDGADVTTIDGGQNGTVLRVSLGARVTLDGLTLRNGSDSGLWNRGTLQVVNCTIRDNFTPPGGANDGAGILQRPGSGPLTLRNCTVTNNVVPSGSGDYGGGLYALDGGPVLLEDSHVFSNRSYSGAGLFASNTDVTIRRSTINANRSTSFGAVYSVEGGDLRIENSTITENRGGGVEFGLGNCVIRNSTITHNTGLGGSAGIFSFRGVEVDLRNTVVAANTGGPGGEDLIGDFVSSGHNLIGVSEQVIDFVHGQLGDQVGSVALPLDPGLGPLADNGGSTLTRRPLQGSPLIDAADPVHFEAEDQRGVSRWSGAADVGSTEASLGVPIDSCTTTPNSTGQHGVIDASGSTRASDDGLELHASQLPPSTFGIFIASRTTGFLPHPGGSAGNLCLSGQMARFRRPDQIRATGDAGAMELQVPLRQVPQGAGVVSVVAGETWSFQAWHRDVAAGAVTSNFTDGLTILFN